MHYSKLKISIDATSKLRSLRQRVGLTPNLICRYALMSSLEDGPLGNTPPPDQDGQEFNAYTLTGELNEMFLALIRFVEESEGSSPLTDEEVLSRLRGHIHRGVGGLAVRAKTPADLVRARTNA